MNYYPSTDHTAISECFIQTIITLIIIVLMHPGDHIKTEFDLPVKKMMPLQRLDTS